MRIRSLSIPHAFEVTPTVHADDRGQFLESYRSDVLESALGYRLDVRQANTSVSHRGVVRGIHYALMPVGQAKWVSVARGSVIDFIVDLRVGSPTFGRWESLLLDDLDHRSVYLAEGLGHAVLALENNVTLNYLCSAVYNPERELSINITDPEIALTFPTRPDPSRVSPRDLSAPTLASALEAGSLPRWDECLAHYSQLSNQTS